jgi:hypothetical protein
MPPAVTEVRRPLELTAQRRRSTNRIGDAHVEDVLALPVDASAKGKRTLDHRDAGTDVVDLDSRLLVELPPRSIIDALAWV